MERSNSIDDRSIQGFSRSDESLIPEQKTKDPLNASQLSGDFFASGNKILRKTDAHFGYHSTLQEALLNWLKPTIRQEITSPRLYYQIFNRFSKKIQAYDQGSLDDAAPEQVLEILRDMESSIEQLNQHLIGLRKS
jgi:hypothetical protein